LAVAAVVCLFVVPGCSGFRSDPAITTSDIRPIPGQTVNYEAMLPSPSTVPQNTRPANPSRYASADITGWNEARSWRSLSSSSGRDCFG
jgi:hypothetical protein